MYKLLAQDGRARRGAFETPRGTIQLPAFMNVGTSAAIKGGVSSHDLVELKCQVELCNTYHLHVRPGEEVVNKLGGIHKFMGWDGPVLTDSGGFQVFSLAKIRTIEELGVTFQSHVDGKKIFMGPEESMQIQSKLGSTIAMAFDECIDATLAREYVEKSVLRTTRWLRRCVKEMARLNNLPETINPKQMLFGINQGSVFKDIRKAHMEDIAPLNLDGYAIGGLSVGEPPAVMYEITEHVTRFMPEDKPRYLMGVGTPSDIIESVWRGIDLFDCVIPSRNARHGTVYTWDGIMIVGNSKFTTDSRPIDESCDCPVCQKYSRGYLRHLLKSKEILAGRLLVMHNLYFYNTLMERIRGAIEEKSYAEFRKEMLVRFAQRV